MRPRRPTNACSPVAAALILAAVATAAPSGVATDAALAADQARGRPRAQAVTGEIRHAGGVIRLTYDPRQFDIDTPDMLEWVRRSAVAISVYFGRFPVPEAHLTIRSTSNQALVGGRAWSDPEPTMRITLDRRVTARALARDSVLVHEMAHLAIPDLDERHLWLHEGIASYVEFVARAQAGLAPPEVVWAEFVREMPAGLPGGASSDGLDGATSTDRVYWGGALYCLLADIEIRKETGNRYGLQDALRALQAAGGDLSKTWSLARILATADSATGTRVMRQLYRRHGARAGDVDLERLWRDLGLEITGRRLRLDDGAPLAAIRQAITSRPSLPLLVATPVLRRVGTQVAAGPRRTRLRSYTVQPAEPRSLTASPALPIPTMTPPALPPPPAPAGHAAGHAGGAAAPGSDLRATGVSSFAAPRLLPPG